MSAKAPDGTALAPVATLGPASSHGYVVAAAAAGTYTWSAVPRFGFGDPTTIEAISS